MSLRDTLRRKCNHKPRAHRLHACGKPGHYDLADRLAEEKDMVDNDGRPVHLICPKEDGSYRVLSTRYPNTIEGLHLAVKTGA